MEATTKTTRPTIPPTVIPSIIEGAVGELGFMIQAAGDSGCGTASGMSPNDLAHVAARQAVWVSQLDEMIDRSGDWNAPDGVRAAEYAIMQAEVLLTMAAAVAYAMESVVESRSELPEPLTNSLLSNALAWIGGELQGDS